MGKCQSTSLWHAAAYERCSDSSRLDICTRTGMTYLVCSAYIYLVNQVATCFAEGRERAHKVTSLRVCCWDGPRLTESPLTSQCSSHTGAPGWLSRVLRVQAGATCIVIASDKLLEALRGAPGREFGWACSSTCYGRAALPEWYWPALV